MSDTLGWIYYQKGVYRSAIDMFQESLRLNEKAGGSDDPSVHYHLGLAYQKANQPSQARQQLERALKISPNFSDAAEARKALSELRGSRTADQSGDHNREHDQRTGLGEQLQKALELALELGLGFEHADSGRG